MQSLLYIYRSCLGTRLFVHVKGTVCQYLYMYAIAIASSHHHRPHSLPYELHVTTPLARSDKQPHDFLSPTTHGTIAKHTFPHPFVSSCVTFDGHLFLGFSFVPFLTLIFIFAMVFVIHLQLSTFFVGPRYKTGRDIVAFRSRQLIKFRHMRGFSKIAHRVDRCTLARSCPAREKKQKEETMEAKTWRIPPRKNHCVRLGGVNFNAVRV